MKYNKSEEWGIPYRGSKRQIASGIINAIRRASPSRENFVDMFGGGGAISFEACLYDGLKRVIYLEKSKQIAYLMQDILNEDIRNDWKIWRSKETFERLKHSNSHGLLAVMWSFGNDGRSYAFSSENERIKEHVWGFVVNKRPDSLAFVNDFFDLKLKLSEPTLFGEESIQDRYKRLRNAVLKLDKDDRYSELSPLWNINQILKIQRDIKYFHKMEAYQANALNFLEDSEALYSLIPKDTIIYFDPPYVGTVGYKEIFEGDIVEYGRSLIEKGFRVFLSEYDNKIENAELLWSKEKLVLAGRNSNSKKAIERLWEIKK